MVNAAIVVFTAVIDYNTMFQFFTVRADFLLKWRNLVQIEMLLVLPSWLVPGINIMQFGILIFLDAQKIEFLGTLTINTRLKAFKLIFIS